MDLAKEPKWGACLKIEADRWNLPRKYVCKKDIKRSVMNVIIQMAKRRAFLKDHIFNKYKNQDLANA